MSASGGYGAWGWSGACAPGSGNMAGASTFSVGVFPRKPHGKRAGAAVLRIVGSRDDRGMDRVAAVASMACACLSEPGAKPADVVAFLRHRTSGETRVVLTKAGREAAR